MKERKAHMQDAFWLRLDNAAKIYPAISTNELTSVFRLSVVLKERIKAKQFLEAVAAVESRFPYYKVKLKAGFFWYYLQHHNGPIPVMADTGIPCRSFGKGELMFRIMARDKSISVEFSHVLTDATGALEFLKSLLFIYCSCCGVSLPASLSFLRPNDTPAEEEYEDAYSRYFKKNSITAHPATFCLPSPFSAEQACPLECTNNGNGC